MKRILMCWAAQNGLMEQLDEELVARLDRAVTECNRVIRDINQVTPVNKETFSLFLVEVEDSLPSMDVVPIDVEANAEAFERFRDAL